jgi:hypothetical protein
MNFSVTRQEKGDLLIQVTEQQMEIKDSSKAEFFVVFFKHPHSSSEYCIAL